MEVESINIKQSRFSDAPWFDRAKSSDVIIGGIGNIGSWVSLFLARQGVALNVYDYDNVDEVNLASQLYNLSSIGTPKVQALEETLNNYVDNDYGQMKFTPLGKLTEDNCVVDKYCFSCFDNMEARKTLFEKWASLYKDSQDAIFIDGRLLAEFGQVFIVTPDRIEDYRKTLFFDTEVAKENCAYKGTTHCSAMIASLMVSAFNNFLVNLDSNVRDLPFNIDFQLPLFNFEIK